MEQVAEKLLEFAQTGASVAAKGVTEITNEYLNFLIFEASLGIVKSLIFLLIPLVIFKVLGTLKHTFDPEKEKGALAILGGFRALSIVACLLLITFTSIDDGRRLAKIIIAPKVFILEESAKLLKQGK